MRFYELHKPLLKKEDRKLSQKSDKSTLNITTQKIINSTPTIALKMSPQEALTGTKPIINYDMVTKQQIQQNMEEHTIL